MVKSTLGEIIETLLHFLISWYPIAFIWSDMSELLNPRCMHITSRFFCDFINPLIIRPCFWKHSIMFSIMKIRLRYRRRIGNWRENRHILRSIQTSSRFSYWVILLQHRYIRTNCISIRSGGFVHSAFHIPLHRIKLTMASKSSYPSRYPRISSLIRLYL